MEEEEIKPIFQYKAEVPKKNVKAVVDELKELGFKSSFEVVAEEPTYLFIWPHDQKFGKFYDKKEFILAEGHILKPIEEIIG